MNNSVWRKRQIYEKNIKPDDTQQMWDMPDLEGDSINGTIHCIIEWGTWSWKTYEAINKARQLGTFMYLAPCRQLVYESFLKYKRAWDTLSTWEIQVTQPWEYNNEETSAFYVYESITNGSHLNYDTLIIDEAQFLCDYERWLQLYSAIQNFPWNIFLVTATRTFSLDSLEEYKQILLNSPQEFKKEKIDENEFFYRVQQWEPSLIFHKYMNNCGIYWWATITANTLPYDRLITQLRFAKWKRLGKKGQHRYPNLVEATNVVAQGLNFPATNVMIIDNEYDSYSTELQKLGRLWRRWLTDSNTRLTYCFSVDNYNDRDYEDYDYEDETDDRTLEYIQSLVQKSKTPISDIEYQNPKFASEMCPSLSWELKQIFWEEEIRNKSSKINEYIRTHNIPLHAMPYICIELSMRNKYEIPTLIEILSRFFPNWKEKLYPHDIRFIEEYTDSINKTEKLLTRYNWMTTE